MTITIEELDAFANKEVIKTLEQISLTVDNFIVHCDGKNYIDGDKLNRYLRSLLLNKYTQPQKHT